ncbi:MAG: hypothetical protein IJW82_00625 [Clostridia bacterium]|nr:hypothetical protein [Clostridia bacterium]
MKKIIVTILALMFSIPSMFYIVGCTSSQNSETKIMTISLNPKLELIINSNEVIESINSLNDDGNHIIMLANKKNLSFENLKVEECIELFLEISKENGYLVTGNEEELTIGMSGNSEVLLDKIKNTANKFFNNNQIDTKIKTEKINKSDIVKELTNCMQEYAETDLEEMKEKDLINLLKQSRKETSDLPTQELKEIYYNLRYDAINTIEFDKILELINELPEITDKDQLSVAEDFVEQMQNLSTYKAELEKVYETSYLSEDCDYKKLMESYTYAKESLLSKRMELGKDNIISDEDLEILKEYETVVESAKTELENLRLIINEKITKIKNNIESIIEQLNSIKQNMEEIIKEINKDLMVNLKELEKTKEETKEEFKKDFSKKNNFNNYIGKDKSHWEFDTHYINEDLNLQTLIDNSQSGDVIRLNKDIILDEQLIINKKIVLDLCGHKIFNENNIWNSENKKWSLISVIDGGDLTIKNGFVIAKEYDCYAIDIRGGKVTIESGKYIGNVHCIYVHTGSLIINGGEFDIQQLSEVTNDSSFTINCLDTNFANNTASVLIKGGKFANFNPMESKSENPVANFLSSDCKIETENIGLDIWYKVVRNRNK